MNPITHTQRIPVHMFPDREDDPPAPQHGQFMQSQMTHTPNQMSALARQGLVSNPAEEAPGSVAMVRSSNVIDTSAVGEVSATPPERAATPFQFWPHPSPTVSFDDLMPIHEDLLKLDDAYAGMKKVLEKKEAGRAKIVSEIGEIKTTKEREKRENDLLAYDGELSGLRAKFKALETKYQGKLGMQGALEFREAGVPNPHIQDRANRFFLLQKWRRDAEEKAKPIKAKNNAAYEGKRLPLTLESRPKTQTWKELGLEKVLDGIREMIENADSLHGIASELKDLDLEKPLELSHHLQITPQTSFPKKMRLLEAFLNKMGNSPGPHVLRISGAEDGTYARTYTFLKAQPPRYDEDESDSDVESQWVMLAHSSVKPNIVDPFLLPVGQVKDIESGILHYVDSGVTRTEKRALADRMQGQNIASIFNKATEGGELKDNILSTVVRNHFQDKQNAFIHVYSPKTVESIAQGNANSKNRKAFLAELEIDDAEEKDLQNHEWPYLTLTEMNEYGYRPKKLDEEAKQGFLTGEYDVIACPVEVVVKAPSNVIGESFIWNHKNLTKGLNTRTGDVFEGKPSDYLKSLVAKGMDLPSLSVERIIYDLPIEDELDEPEHASSSGSVAVDDGADTDFEDEIR